MFDEHFVFVEPLSEMWEVPVGLWALGEQLSKTPTPTLPDLFGRTGEVVQTEHQFLGAIAGQEGEPRVSAATFDDRVGFEHVDDLAPVDWIATFPAREALGFDVDDWFVHLEPPKSSVI
jgi:hypothetical protein